MDKKVVIIFAVVIYLLSAFASYSYFSASSVSTSKYEEPVTEAGGSTVDGGPKTEPCPMNGQLYSKEQKKLWEKRRPLGIMVQNNTEARPQSGLSAADIIHEAVAEGGITRFLTIYYCEQPEIVGSVRSARIYFIKLLQGFGNNPLYAHVGGANMAGPADAIGELQDLEWWGYNDLDQFAVPFPNYWRDYDRLPNRATEHTVYTNTQKLWEFAAKTRKLTNVDKKGVAWDEDWEQWKFAEDAKESARGNIKTISFSFWDNSLGSDYKVVWNYDIASNSYLRVNGGKKHIDLDTGKQLTAKNIVVVFSDESIADDGYEHGQHLLYDLLGEGDALVIQNGKSIKASWSKPKEERMMRFENEDGDEIEFVRGKIWIEVVPTGNKVTAK
ncbi:hypothetical protein A3A93_03425 [Candidatus Roizmanbacteria bacterium RIFCSPLOWO2_01_FULL_38_12]|uniref:DUF3048 domain-containing protein n=1 Tax=Candidatus Roizmanbacteria bacterium RIFCSPLOWO2_01_FULL_38_12 TaxID=1802061 RepID=A0A1F7ISN9_9BACT|nr:MAG: hypothetical protein A2861_01305 [Candidatus Roizmanbacteria bacterium RIFCSPHIGHO2_01_FULL_38_15]OGK35820.1 MAG: hypothetical protein A3F59_03710 [Candidatus Roizmanbacteria bacterium RIFCSPHIGHO2_12_FULL_38_13]OGK46393.1 MAG: hypothetical protein A3A93_03425 [Candidatus Roizmanbacteria bacterium RIFCSPLOWO2_01_FULL_38_12]